MKAQQQICRSQKDSVLASIKGNPRVLTHKFCGGGTFIFLGGLATVGYSVVNHKAAETRLEVFKRAQTELDGVNQIRDLFDSRRESLHAHLLANHGREKGQALYEEYRDSATSG